MDRSNDESTSLRMIDQRNDEPNALYQMSRHVEVGQRQLPGLLATPPRAAGVVLFSEVSALGRHDEREQRVARALYDAGLAVLLVDVAHVHAEDTRPIEDVEILAERVRHAIDWIRRRDELRSLRRGCFGSGTGGAAALVAAAQDRGALDAVVARNACITRLAEELRTLDTPTRLIFDEEEESLDEALRHEVAATGGAESGDGDETCSMVRDWFARHLAR